MAHIVPSLNLNKTPQQVQPYSLIFAKNIKLDETGGSIVKDDCLKENKIKDYLKGDTIVGCISTPNEILVFVNHENNVRIIRYNENLDKVNIISTSLDYNNGEFIGTYNYNIKNELIIVFSEKNADKDIPLRTINCGTFSNVQNVNKTDTVDNYNIVPNVPFCDFKLNTIKKGINIPNGVYQFFIRYKYKNDFYSNWFPIGRTYFAINYENTIFHDYHVYSDKGYNRIEFPINNVNHDCNYGFIFSISFTNLDDTIKEYDLGYILQQDNNKYCRLYTSNKLYHWDTLNIVSKIIFDGLYKTELTLNDFFKFNFNIYNVKNIVNYNNRIYISNYKEDLNNIEIDVSNIKCRYVKLDGNNYINPEYKSIGTLIPGNAYSFFIHFVRSDGSYTNGIRLINDVKDNFPNEKSRVAGTEIEDDDRTGYYKFNGFKNSKDENLFKLPLLNPSLDKSVIIPCFFNITVPDNFKGYFISYEKVESLVLYQGIIKSLIRSNDAELGLIPYKGNFVYYPRDSNTKYAVSEYNDMNLLISNTHNKTLGKTGGIEIKNINNIIGDHKYDNKDIIIISYNENIYTKDKKILYRLTNIFDKNKNNISYIDELNLPEYYCKEYVIEYPRGFYVSDDVKFLDNNDNSFVDTDKTYRFSFFTKGTDDLTEETIDCSYIKYSLFNLYSLSIKIKPLIKAIVDKENSSKIYIQKYVDPATAYDTFELKSDYNLHESGNVNELFGYTNYIENSAFLEQFDNTVRRSDVFANESVENTWRNFTGSNYKVISNTRGKIKKLIPLGKYFLIHLEQGLFVFDRDNKMKLQDKEIQLSTPDTFDLEAQEVYTSENGFLGLQDEEASIVTNYGYTFYERDTKTIYNYDAGKLSILSLPIQNLLENISVNKVSMAYDGNNSRTLMCFTLTDGRVFTISYNHLVKSFISLHDFKFDKCWNTKCNPYLRTCNKDKILIFTKEYCKDTYNTANIYNRTTISTPVEEYDTSKQLFPVICTTNNDSVESSSIIDVIFNEGYDVPKVLNSISYILSKIIDSDNNKFQAEINIDTEFSGDKLVIYSDRCNTETIDISKESNVSKYGNPDYPWFDKGIWNFNGFRNIRNMPIGTDLSLIYGKYFVIRFIFNSTINFKLENLTCNIQRYSI